jgi:hypothetical protein
LLLVAGLVFAAIRLGRRTRPADDRSVPRVLTVFVLMLMLALVHGFAEETWTGVAMTAGPMAAAALLLARWSRRDGWATGHVVAAATAPLLVRAVLAFTYDPLVGEVSEAAKYGHNAVMLLIVLGAVALTRRRTPRPVETMASSR